MQRLIDATALYEQIDKKEELARQRVLDTPSRMPNGDFNPSAIRYATQLDERTQMKFMIADAPTIDAVPLDGSFLKMSRGDYLIYKRHWLYEHFDMEMDIQRSAMKSMGYEPALKDTEPHWIPCSERMPENMETVNITWVNRRPVSYYMHIKDKPFTATGIYFKGKWYWWSSTCDDMLCEYGQNEIDEVDGGIEIVAWMPLPKPYEGDKE